MRGFPVSSNTSCKVSLWLGGKGTAKQNVFKINTSWKNQHMKTKTIKGELKLMF